MLTQNEISETILKKISRLISVDVDDIDIFSTFDQVGLDSLSLAMLLIELEKILKHDPFGEGKALLSDMKSINDIINIYVKNQTLLSR
ncbi:acyl carrier protein [Serratia sp. 2723]|uniref:acyl carrier protein n=1 Tax=unclassified Serratia (in: enterobacteria) TaxID=2647522 RepID=UPI003D2490B7